MPGAKGKEYSAAEIKQSWDMACHKWLCSYALAFKAVPSSQNKKRSTVTGVTFSEGESKTLALEKVCRRYSWRAYHALSGGVDNRVPTKRQAGDTLLHVAEWVFLSSPNVYVLILKLQSGGIRRWEEGIRLWWQSIHEWAWGLLKKPWRAVCPFHHVRTEWDTIRWTGSMVEAGPL